VDPFPAPDLDDCIRRVEGATVFSAIDLKAGFHNVEIREDCRPYCGFVT